MPRTDQVVAVSEHGPTMGRARETGGRTRLSRVARMRPPDIVPPVPCPSSSDAPERLNERVPADR
jgi:hypothetical protein